MSAAEAAPSFSNTTMENARKAKVSMEQFYENLLIQDRDRSNRWKKLELSMEEMSISEEEVGRVPWVMATRCSNGGPLYRTNIVVYLFIDISHRLFSCICCYL